MARVVTGKMPHSSVGPVHEMLLGDEEMTALFCLLTDAIALGPDNGWTDGEIACFRDIRARMPPWIKW